MKPEKINTEFVAVQHYAYDGLIKDWHTLELLRDFVETGESMFSMSDVIHILLGIEKEDEDD